MTTPAAAQTAFIQAWQAQRLLSNHQSQSLEETIKEPPNAVVVCINLQNLPLKDTAEWVQHATEDEIKEHKGIRASLFVTKILYAGFTFVPPPAGADKSVRGERLATLDDVDEHSAEKRSVIFYTYKGEQNKKLDTYVKTKRYEECTSVSQGMVITGSIWANKLQNMLKKSAHFENIGVFDLCLVHLGIKSIMSKASENGMMLEIKSVTPLSSSSHQQQQLRMSMPHLVPHTLPPRSVQESVEFRNKFMDGLLVSEEKRKHLKQDLIKGNYSTSMHLVALAPEPEHGIVALSADGKLKFFQRQPIGDINAATMELKYDTAFHCPVDPGNNDEVSVEWMAKLFNVAMMMGALELFVVADEYRMRGGNNNSKKDAPATADIHLQAYARVNEKQILSKLIAASNAGPLLHTEEEEIHGYISAQGVDTKHLVIFQRCAKNLDLVVDLRRMTNKRATASSAATLLSTLVHSDGPWSKGHMMHAFYEKKCVLSVVVSLSDVQTAADGATYKRALEPVQLAKCMDVVYDEEEPEVQAEEAPAAAANATTATATATTASTGKPAKKKAKPAAPEPSTP